MDQVKPKQTLSVLRAERDALTKLAGEIALREAEIADRRALMQTYAQETRERYSIEDGVPCGYNSDFSRFLVFEKPPAAPGKPTPEPSKADAPPKNEAPKNGQHVHPPEPAKT